MIEVAPPATANYEKLLNQGKTFLFGHHWGDTHLKRDPSKYLPIILHKADGKVLRGVNSEYFAQFPEVAKGDKATPEQALAAARWALAHDLPERCLDALEKYSTLVKEAPQATAFKKFKDNLKLPLAPISDSALKGLVPRSTINDSEKHHFALSVSAAASKNPNESRQAADVKRYLDRLEDAFVKYHLWWVLQGVSLPFPKERPVFILSGAPGSDRKDFLRLQSTLSAGAVISDSFFARREGASVYAGQRHDQHYHNLFSNMESEWPSYDRKGLLRASGDKYDGIPATLRIDPKWKLAPKEGKKEFLIPVRTHALVLEALDNEWEANSVSHMATRQLLFASGQLPNKVKVPEWIQFGMGAFFEARLQSPVPIKRGSYSGPGGPNSYWLPRFNEYQKAKKYEANALATLKKIVSDDYFHRAAKGGEKKEALDRQARAAAWSLTFYLAQCKLDGLQTYFKELSKLPRDAELDSNALLACFAKSFGCMSGGRPNDTDLANLAAAWVNYNGEQRLEAEKAFETIREAYKMMTTPPATGGTGGGGTGGNPGIGKI